MVRTTKRLLVPALASLVVIAALGGTARAASEPSQIAFNLRNAIGVVTPKNPSSETPIDGPGSSTPVYSPTGEVLAYHKFVIKNNVYHSLIVLVNRFDLKSVETIDFGPRKTFVGTDGYTHGYQYDGLAPTWSPSGDELAYYCGTKGDVYFLNGDQSYSQSNLCVINLITRKVRLVAESSPQMILGGKLSWSPDGKHIAAQTVSHPTSDSVEYDIREFSPNGGGGKLLVKNGLDIEYSPNGRKIVYTDTSNPKLDTVVADSGGGDPETVFSDRNPTRDEYVITQAAFSPDSKDLVISDYGDNYNLDLFEIKAAPVTQHPIQLTHTGGDDETYPEWAPPVTTCTVPKLKGETLKEAKTAIELAACSLGKVKGNRKGKVVDQSPKPNHNVKAGSKVDIKLKKPRHRG